MRVNVYVDGFNLYYGALKGTPYRWLDLHSLCRRLLPRDEINRIRYFTARVAARPDDPDGPVRQDAYLRALATISGLSIHYGEFRVTTVRMPIAHPSPGAPRTVEVIKTEEKGSDVNLASYLLLDAVRRDCELAAVVSNDSDLCEPIRIVKDELGVPAGLINPHRNASNSLLALRPLFVKHVRRGPPSVSQFPEKLTDAHGEVRKPARW